MTPQLIIALAIALGGFGSAWQIQNWRFDAKEKVRAEQKLADERVTAEANLRQAKSVVNAQNAATVRAAALRRDADGARNESDRLRTSRDEAVRAAAASHNACLERIDAFSVVLGTVEAAGREVSAKADRHASDAQTLIAAWPK